MANAELSTGNLQETSVPQLFFQVSERRGTGLLVIQNDSGEKKYIYFNDGAIAAGYSTVASESLAQVLATNGVITESQRKQVQDLTTRAGQEAEVLKNLGLVTEEETVWWAKVLMRDIVQNLFIWVNGVYKYIPGRKPPEYIPYALLDTQKTVYATIRRINEISIVTNWFGSFDITPRLNPDFLKGKLTVPMKLTSHEGYVLSRINGKTSLRDIMAISGPNKMETARFLYIAYLFGLMELELPKVRVGDSLGTSRNELDDVELTDEEMREIAHAMQEQDDGAVPLNAKVAYLRGDRYMEDEEAVDPNAVLSDKREKKDVGDDSIIYIIDGEEIDGTQLHLLSGEATAAGFSEYSLAQKKSIEEQWEEWVRSSQNAPEDAENGEAQIDERWSAWIEMNRQRDEILQEIRVFEVNEKEELQLPGAKSNVKSKLTELQSKLAVIEERKKQDIVHFYRRSQLQNHYEILGLAVTVSMEEIQTAYFKWAQEFNPELTNETELGPVMQFLESFHKRLTEAYENLSDPEKRRSYDQQLEEKARVAKLAEERKRELATKNYAMAEQLITKGDLWRSTEYLRASISLNPQEPKYYVSLAQILETDPKWYWEAMKNYNRCIKLEPTNAMFYFKIGKVFQRMKRMAQAQNAFRMSLRFDPQNQEILRAMNEVG